MATCIHCAASIPKGDNCCAACFERNETFKAERPPRSYYFIQGRENEPCERKCQQCGEMFASYRIKGSGDKVGFCSSSCNDLFQVERYHRDVHCYWCGAGFVGHVNKQYCSEACRVAAHRAGKQRPQHGKGERKERRPPLLKLRFDIFERDGFKCRYCGRSADAGAVLHVDHVHPKSQGGDWAPDNLLTACQECNLGKGCRILTARP